MVAPWRCPGVTSPRPSSRRSSGRRCSSGWPRDVRRARRRRRDHRRRRRPRRRHVGACARPRRGRGLRLRDVVEELQAGPRRAPLPAAGRRPPRLRGAPRAQAAAPQRPAPRQDPPVPDPDPHQGRPDPPPRRSGPRLGDVDVRPHRRLAHRQAAQAPRRRRGPRPPADDAGENLACGYLYYDATVDDARLVLTVARTRPRTAPSSPTGPRSSAFDHDRTGARSAAPSTPATARSTSRRVGRQRRRRLGRRGPHARGRRRPPTRSGPAKGIHLTVPWATGAQRHRRRHPGPGGQAQPVRRALGPAGRRHVRAHLHRHDRHRLRRPARRPAVHRRGHRLRARRRQRRRDDRDHRRRRHRRLGRPAPAGAVGERGRTADLSPPPPGDDRTRRRRHRHRRQADDLPRDGRGHGRRGRAVALDDRARCRTKRLRLLGADGFTEAPGHAKRPPR